MSWDFFELTLKSQVFVSVCICVAEAAWTPIRVHCLRHLGIYIIYKGSLSDYTGLWLLRIQCGGILMKKESLWHVLSLWNWASRGVNIDKTSDTFVNGVAVTVSCAKCLATSILDCYRCSCPHVNPAWLWSRLVIHEQPAWAVEVWSFLSQLHRLSNCKADIEDMRGVQGDVFPENLMRQP